MVNIEKCIAAGGGILIACLLLVYGETSACIAIGSALVAFFVGDSNGRASVAKKVVSS